MVKAITLIPTHRNDGSPVSEAEFDGIVQRILEKFGGVTIAGRTLGHWTDPKSGQNFKDTCWQVFSCVEDSKVEEFKDLVVQIGRQLGQLAMYFEAQKPEIWFLDC